MVLLSDLKHVLYNIYHADDRTTIELPQRMRIETEKGDTYLIRLDKIGRSWNVVAEDGQMWTLSTLQTMVQHYICHNLWGGADPRNYIEMPQTLKI